MGNDDDDDDDYDDDDDDDDRVLNRILNIWCHAVFSRNTASDWRLYNMQASEPCSYPKLIILNWCLDLSTVYQRYLKFCA